MTRKILTTATDQHGTFRRARLPIWRCPQRHRSDRLLARSWLFVHTGHDRSFVYDIADLYKAKITIPIAFEVTATNPDDIVPPPDAVVRDAISDGHILEQTAKLTAKRNALDCQDRRTVHIREMIPKLLWEFIRLFREGRKTRRPSGRCKTGRFRSHAVR